MHAAELRTQAQCTAAGRTWYEAHDVYGGVAPGSVPTVPTAVSAKTTVDGGAVEVSFSAPTDHGGHTLTGYKGVFPGDAGGFTAQVWTGRGGPVLLGSFETAVEAAVAYKAESPLNV